ncbi:MAG: chloride channel protein [Rickettsiaceae bacterium]|nr:chloride channel protein [Rickettsiaceae bacterium]
MVSSLKKHFHQSLFLLGASLFLSFFVVIYNLCFELGIHFYRHFYNSYFFFLGIFFIAFSSCVCTKWAAGARGSGHDLGKRYFDEFQEVNSIQDESIKDRVETYFSDRVILIKIISSSLATFGGAALGREGPLVHMSMALLVSFKKKVREFEITPSSILILGTCIGFAAAFREPILGLIYIFEIFGFRKASQHFFHNLMILLCSIYLSRFVLEELLNISPIIFNLPSEVAEDLLIFIRQSDWVNFAFIIGLAAVSGAVSGVLIHISRQHIHDHFKKASNKFLMFLPLIVGAFIVFFAQLGSERVLGPVGYLLVDILYSPDITSSFDFIGKYLNCLLSLAVGCAGGVVIPAITLGAIFGDVASGIFATSAPFLIMLCAATFLSSVINAPLTAASFVIMFTKLDFNVAICVIIASYLSYYFSIIIKKIGRVTILMKKDVYAIPN